MEMNKPSRAGRMLWSAGAIIAGLVSVVALSIGTDSLLQAAGMFPAAGQRLPDAWLVLATIYRTLYGIVGGYVAARFAPDRPLMHALILGAIGLALAGLGAAVTWNAGPAFDPKWYPLALVVVALPSSWWGGWLFQRTRQTSLD